MGLAAKTEEKIDRLFEKDPKAARMVADETVPLRVTQDCVKCLKTFKAEELVAGVCFWCEPDSPPDEIKDSGR